MEKPKIKPPNKARLRARMNREALLLAKRTDFMPYPPMPSPRKAEEYRDG